MFETGSGRFPSIYNTNSTSTIENLQAQLKQRDGKNFFKRKLRAKKCVFWTNIEKSKLG